MARYVIKPHEPFVLKEALWPHVRLYDKQVEIVRSVFGARETHVTAGNQLGKDFIAGFIATTAFVICQARGVTCRIVTTSVAEHHLKVLWGEIGRFISTSRKPLVGRAEDQLSVNFQEVRRAPEALAKNPLNYLVGRVSEKGEGLAGHHADFTLLIGDEASGLDDEVHEMAEGWAAHMLFIGNPNPCQNFWRKQVDAGSGPEKRVLRIRAEDSPNVRARSDTAFPGVLGFSDYTYRRENWDPVRQCVGLDAQFWMGADLLLYPPDRLNEAEEYDRYLGSLPKGKRPRRRARAMGVDPAMGGDETAWTVVDEYGILDQVSHKTPDTSDVFGETVALMREWNLEPENVLFDMGGGGKPHADYLRKKGYDVRTVFFGESAGSPTGVVRVGDKVMMREDRYTYTNLRAKMYGRLSELLAPPRHPVSYGEDDGQVGTVIEELTGVDHDMPHGFGIPAHLTELRRQMSVISRLYDAEGRLYIPPKDRKPGAKKTTQKTLTELLGRSPDQLDSLVLAVHCMLTPPEVYEAGALG